MTKILLIDHHISVRQGISLLFKKEKHLEVVGECSSQAMALELCNSENPHIILLELSFDECLNSLEIIEQINQYHPEIKILILTYNQTEFYKTDYLKLGVAGFITKNNTFKELVKAITLIQKGHYYIDSEFLNDFLLNNNANIFNKLSPKEHQVFLLLIKGIPIKAIAKHLNVKVKTVHSFRNRIFKKLNVDSDVNLVRLARRHRVL